MNREKSFVQLLIKYTIILLLPVIVVGLLITFLHLEKLKKEFEELNTKAMETANMRMDMLMEDFMTVYYQLSIDTDVRTFLTQEFGSNQERISLMKNIKDTVTESLFNKDGIASVVLYSKINDVFIGEDSVLERREYYERFFSKSNYEYEELFDVLESARTVPAWLVTDEYLIYCSNAMMLGRSDKGRFLAAVEKQKVLDILTDVCDNPQIGCAVLYRNKEILMQTESFHMQAFGETEKVKADNAEYRYKDNLIKRYSSQKAGGLTYVYTINYESFGGNIAQVVRSLVLTILGVLLVSVIFARRKMKDIRDMYVNLLKENSGLENHLNVQVEKLNQQLLRNALRGHDTFASEKQHIDIESSRIRVLIFQFADQDDFCLEAVEKDIRGMVKCILETEWTKHLFLYEKEVGYICVLGYEIQEKMEEVIEKLQKAFGDNDDIGLFMGLSTQINDIVKLSEAYEQARTALHYCMIRSEESGIVYYDDIKEVEKEKIYYPSEKEKQLLRSIRMGVREEVESCLNFIYQMNFEKRRLSKGSIRHLLVRMLNTVYELIDVVYNGELQKYDDFGRVSRNVLQADNMKYAFEIIRSIALSICDRCSDGKERELRQQIITYINENFTDQDLSLEKMASDFEMSYYHLSRLFNEYMQMNFVTYLTGIRLEYSGELLRTTAFSVEQVAIRSGFLQSGSFIRAFKKYYGVTPGKYREERQKK